MTNIKIVERVVKELPTERPLIPGEKYKVLQPNGDLLNYTIDSEGNPVFIRGVSNEQNVRLERLNNAQVTKLEGLNTQEEIDAKLEEFASNAVSSLVPVEGTVLPRGADIPDYITTRGRADLYGGSSGPVVYTNTGLPSPDDIITVPQGSVMQAFYDKSTDSWSGGPTQVLPVDPNAVKKADINVDGGVTGFDLFKGVTVVDSSGSNLIDRSTAQFGYINSNNGGYTPSDNWIRIPYLDVPEDVKGTYVSVQRGTEGSLGSGANLVSFRDSNGDYMAAYSIPGYSDTPFPSEVQVFVPEGAMSWAFSIRNVVGLTDPVNNEWTQSFSVITEEIESILLDASKLDKPDVIPYTNKITEDGAGAVPASEIYPISDKINSVVDVSPNMVDMSSGVVPGFWLTSGGHSTSNNWIKKERFNLSEDIVNRLSNGEQVYLWVFGGGPVGSGGASVVFWDGDNSVVYSESGSGGSTYPLRVLVPSTARSMGVTIANVVGIGLDPLNSPYKGTFYVGVEQESEVQPEYQPYGYVIKPSAIPELNINSVDTSEIVFRKINNDLFHIYYHIGGPSNLWFRINLRHQISESKFIDVWRIEQGYIVQRSDDDFINVREIVMAGVYENAIYMNGYSDALGSAHGWEILERLNVWMDGSELDILSDDFQEARGKVFSFNTLTSFRTANGLGEVGKSFKTWIFKDGVFEIVNNINWNANLQVSSTGRSFLGMLSIKRDDASGNITHSAQSNEDGATYDVSVEGFTTPIFTDQQNPRRNTLVVWGDEFKAVVSIDRKIINPDGTENTIGYSNAGGFVQNSALYNKMYLTIGTGSVEPGSSWVTKTTYNLFNKMK